MITAIIVLSALLTIVSVILIGALLHINKIKQQIIDIDKMQHIQKRENQKIFCEFHVLLCLKMAFILGKDRRICKI